MKKKLLATVLIATMVLFMTACGGEEDVQEDASGKVVSEVEEVGNDSNTNQSGTNTNVEEDSRESSGETASAQDGLGLLNPEYQAINPDGTNMDCLAFADNKWIYILNLGEGSNAVADLEINDRGYFGTKDGATDLGFGLEFFSVMDAMVDFTLMNSDIYVRVDGLSLGTTLDVYWENPEILTAEDGSYQLAGNPEYEGSYQVQVNPEGNSESLVMSLRKCETVEEAVAVTEFIQKNIRCYALDEYGNVFSAIDVNGEPVDVSSYKFFKDVLAETLADEFGINVKEPDVLMNGTGNSYDLSNEWGWSLDLDRTLAGTDFAETDAIDFMGYKAYVEPGKEIYLQYNDKDCIYFSTSRKDGMTVEETLSELERQFFSNYPIAE